ncbi:MAG: hypothetical protein E6Q59_08190 [Nitrosomonas sp.]|nr:MAG: hypothetical protein E6Q59_08190 [Nitrosomonas sp.]
METSESKLPLKDSSKSWILDAFVPILGLITGFWGSINSPIIKEAFPLNTEMWFIEPTKTNISLQASVFWFLLICFSALLTFQQFRLHKRRKTDQTTLTNQIKNLENVLGTMPPVDFMDALSDAIKDCDSYITEQKAIAEFSPNNEDEEAAIDLAKDRKNQVRFILSNMIALASQWDNTLASGPHGATYRGNIMIFRSKEYLANLDDAAAKALFSSAKFIHGNDPKTVLQSLDGVLEVDVKMTYRSSSNQSDKANNQSGFIPYDDEVKPFALGVKLITTTGGLSSGTLPGAPEAFVTDRPTIIQDSKTIADLCKRTGCFQEVELASIEKYYDQDEKGRSIICWPIKDERGNGIAVINIYRDKKDISVDLNRANRLVGILQPFTLMFRDILADTD